MMFPAVLPYCASTSQGGEGLGSKDWPNELGSETTHFHGPNVVSCKILWKLLDVEAGKGVATVGYGVDFGVGSQVGIANESHGDL